MKKYELVVKVAVFAHDNREATAIVKKALFADKRVERIKFQGRVKEVIENVIK